MSQIPLIDLDDYHYAVQLDKDLNGAASPICGEDRFSPVSAYFKQDILTANNFLRTASTNSQNEVTFDNQQAITIQKERKLSSDYFMPIINTFIDLSNNQEWDVVNIASNLPKMIDGMVQHYFKSFFPNFDFKVSWDVNNVLSKDSSFKIFHTENEVLVSTSLQTVPRFELISVLFHILIHLYLNKISKDSIKVNEHDENFRRIMIFLNDSLKIKITTSHKLKKSAESFNYTSQWYRCSGICVNYEPFHGIVRCSTFPNQSHSFWIGHDTACGGQFFKLFEMYRNNPTTDEIEKEYVRNVRYMWPKPRPALGKTRDHLKSRAPAREFLDLTEDSEGDTVKVENLCEVIDLDDTVSYIDSPTLEVQYATKFIEYQVEGHALLERCPFCKIGIGCQRLASHFDNCRGYKENINPINFMRKL